MRPIGLLRSSALIASLMILAIAFVLVPEGTWTNTSIASISIFALAFGFVFFIPSALIKQQPGSDADQMASLGPLGVVSSGVVLFTAGAFFLAILGHEKLAQALDIFSLGTLIVSCLVLRTSLSIVGDVSSKYSVSSSHIRWQGEIQGLASAATDHASKISLEKLVETLRYSASDIPGGTPFDGSIGEAIQSIGSQLSEHSNTSLQNQIQKIEMLIVQRDVFLKSARSKA